MLKYIINQDRDGIVELVKTAELFTRPVFGPKGNLWGFNLMYGNPDKPESKNNIILGTFDSIGEAVSEIKTIGDCEDDYYMIVGHCNGGEPNGMLDIFLAIGDEIDAIKKIRLDINEAVLSAIGDECEEETFDVDATCDRCGTPIHPDDWRSESGDSTLCLLCADEDEQ